MTKLYAQPYDTTADGFFFETFEEYTQQANKAKNQYGDPVEEFEIQFIDGEALDCALARAISLSQAIIADFLECVEAWEDWQKINVILAVGELGYDFDASQNPDHYDINIHYVRSMRELAEEFVEEGLFGDIPENLQFYIDYDAIARDLACDYSETEIAGEYLIYRCA